MSAKTLIFMITCVALLCLSENVGAEIFFHETFDTLDHWIESRRRRDYGRVALASGNFVGDPVKQQGLKLLEDQRYYALSRKLPQPVNTVGRNFVISYSVKSEQQFECGGTYLKFFSKDFVPEDLNEGTPYLLMFGSDRCAKKSNVHIIKNYKGQNVPCSNINAVPEGPLTHFFTVAFFTDNTYALYIDGAYRWRSSIEQDWPLLEPPTLLDPEDIKPKDWVDSATMPDPRAVKPDDWDESQPLMIDDMDAVQPEDWDEVISGKWARPQIRNPLYRGDWHPPHVHNPKYKGPWVQKRIPNPRYIPDPDLYQLAAPIEYVGIEVWQVEGGSIYDDIMIGDDVDEILSYVRNALATNSKIEEEMYRRRLEEVEKLEKRHDADVNDAVAVQTAMADDDLSDL